MLPRQLRLLSDQQPTPLLLLVKILTSLSLPFWKILGFLLWESTSFSFSMCMLFSPMYFDFTNLVLPCVWDFWGIIHQVKFLWYFIKGWIFKQSWILGIWSFLEFFFKKLLGFCLNLLVWFFMCTLGYFPTCLSFGNWGFPVFGYGLLRSLFLIHHLVKFCGIWLKIEILWKVGFWVF